MLNHATLILRSCNRSLEAEDPDDASTSPSSTGPSPASRNNSFRDRSRNQSVPLTPLIHMTRTHFCKKTCLNKGCHCASSYTEQRLWAKMSHVYDTVDGCMFSVTRPWTHPSEFGALRVCVWWGVLCKLRPGLWDVQCGIRWHRACDPVRWDTVCSSCFHFWFSECATVAFCFHVNMHTERLIWVFLFLCMYVLAKLSGPWTIFHSPSW